MSERVCYIRRTDRGAALRGVRLIGPHTDDTWRAGSGADPTLILESVKEAAGWVKERLGASGKAGELDMLCLDADGAVCSWVKPDEADPTLLDAAITNSTQSHDPDALEPEPHAGLSDRFPKLPLELSYEPLDADETSTGSRAAVMATPDVPGRLLKDALDAAGVRVERFTTIWHALAAVWDPGANSASRSAQRVVSSDTPIAAVIAMDPSDGRLIWTWSREGRLICAGSARVRLAPGEHETQAILRDEDISRLSSDWLGWSSQLGVSPSRIVVVGEPAQVTPPEDPEQGQSSSIGLTGAQVGGALNRAWPEATIDLLGHSDPIAETLRLIATGARGEALTTLTQLTQRPTRVHRSMYRWAGFALTGVAAIVCLFAYQLFSSANAIRSETKQINNQRTELLSAFDPALIMSPLPSRTLETTLQQMQRSQGPIVVAQAKPILQELETISFVLGIPGIEIDKITLNNRNVTAVVRVENIGQAEQINQSLKIIEGSNLVWRSMNPANRGEKVQATYLASWDDGEGES